MSRFPRVHQDGCNAVHAGQVWCKVQPSVLLTGRVRSGAMTARMTAALPEHQIRRLVVYVHPVVLSAVCAAQVRGRIQLDRQSPVWYFLVD